MYIHIIEYDLSSCKKNVSENKLGVMKNQADSLTSKTISPSSGKT